MCMCGGVADTHTKTGRGQESSSFIATSVASVSARQQSMFVLRIVIAHSVLRYPPSLVCLISISCFCGISSIAFFVFQPMRAHGEQLSTGACGHFIHTKCMRDLLSSAGRKACPVCRASFVARNPDRDRQVEATVLLPMGRGHADMSWESLKEPFVIGLCVGSAGALAGVAMFLGIKGIFF